MYSVKGRLVSTFLTVALILGQLAFLHHSLDLSDHADGEPCFSCLLSASLDHGLIDPPPTAEIQATHCPGNNWQGQPVLSSFTNTFLARAPPA